MKLCRTLNRYERAKARMSGLLALPQPLQSGPTHGRVLRRWSSVVLCHSLSTQGVISFCPSVLFFHLPCWAAPAVPSPRLATSVYPNVSVSLDTRVCRAVFHFMRCTCQFCFTTCLACTTVLTGRRSLGGGPGADFTWKHDVMFVCRVLGIDLGSCRRWCCHLCLHLNPIVKKVNESKRRYPEYSAPNGVVQGASDTLKDEVG